MLLNNVCLNGHCFVFIDRLVLVHVVEPQLIYLAESLDLADEVAVHELGRFVALAERLVYILAFSHMCTLEKPPLFQVPIHSLLYLLALEPLFILF